MQYICFVQLMISLCRLQLKVKKTIECLIIFKKNNNEYKK